MQDSAARFPKPSRAELDAEGRGNQDRRQHGTKVASEFSAGEDERNRPEEEPKNDEVTSVAELFLENQKETNRRAGQGRDRHLDEDQNEIKVPRFAPQPVRETMPIESSHELVTVVAHGSITGEVEYRVPRSG